MCKSSNKLIGLLDSNPEVRLSETIRLDSGAIEHIKDSAVPARSRRSASSEPPSSYAAFVRS
jgi:hypothetical protein